MAVDHVDGRIAMRVPTLQALKKYRVIFITLESLKFSNDNESTYPGYQKILSRAFGSFREQPLTEES